MGQTHTQESHKRSLSSGVGNVLKKKKKKDTHTCSQRLKYGADYDSGNFAVAHRSWERIHNKPHHLTGIFTASVKPALVGVGLI